MVTLENCRVKFLQKGIDVTDQGWQEILSSSLQDYLTFESWDYGYDNDQLSINEIGIVPNNITDFGDAVSS